MRLKSRIHTKKTHLELLLSTEGTYLTFNFSTLIWREDRGGTALSQGQEEGNPHISPPN